MSFKESVLIPLSDYKKLLSFKKQQKNYSDILHDNNMPVDVKMMLYDQEQHLRPIKAKRKYEKSNNTYYENLTSLPPYFIDLGIKLMDFLNQKQKDGSISFQESANGLIVNDHVLPKISLKRLIEVLFSTKDITKKDETNFINIFYKILLRLGYDSLEIPATEWLLKNNADITKNLRMPSFIQNDINERYSNIRSPSFNLLENDTKSKRKKIKPNMQEDEEKNEMFFDAFSNTPERKIDKTDVPILQNESKNISSNKEEITSEEEVTSDDEITSDEEVSSENLVKNAEPNKDKKIKRPNPREPKYPSNFETRSQKKQTGLGFGINQAVKWLIY